MIPSALSGLRILVLEDEFLIAMDVEQICRDHGAASVEIKRDVNELDDGIFASPFDVAVIDIMLGGQSTLPFARTLRERGVPFVFASGYTDVASLTDEFGNVGLIGKPYAEAGLVESIRAAAAERS